MYEIICMSCGNTELSCELSLICSKCENDAIAIKQQSINDLNEYQKLARQTAIYKDGVIYPALGLAGEAGEVCEKVKKILRDKETTFSDISKRKTRVAQQKLDELAKEIGDVLWYCANLCEDLNLSLSDIATLNIAKLFSRKKRNKIKGSGDNR